MDSQHEECGDIEAGECSIEIEIPEHQQAFICKVYLIISIQLLLTFMVVFIILNSMNPLAYFILSSRAVLIFYLIICIIMIIAFCLLYFYHFASFLLLVVFTTALALLVGFTCAPATGKVIVESIMITTAVIVNLTLYSFWGASKGHDFEFLGPFFFTSVVLIMVFASVEIIFPLEKIFARMYGFLGSITFCGHIVYVTDSLIIRNYSCKKYIRAATCLFVEFINLFLLFVTVFKAFDK